MKTNRRIYLIALFILAIMAFLTGYGFEIAMVTPYVIALAPFTIAGKNLKALQEREADVIKERDRIRDEMRTLNDSLVNGENIRDFTNDEKIKYDDFSKELKKCDDELRKLNEAIEVQESLEKDIISRAGNYQRRNPKPIPEQEARENYSFLKGIRSVMAGGKLEGLEAEMHQEGIKEASQDHIELSGRGLVIPKMILDPNPGRRERRDMTVGTATAGGNAVATVLSDFIGYLYNRLVLTQAGADFMTGLIGNVDFPSESAVASATWEGETDSNAESNPTVGKVSMSPKRLGTYSDISTRLLLQTSPSIEERIRRQLVTAIQQGIEVAAINGSGVDPIPEGILNTTGIGSVAGGTDGAEPDWNDIVNLEKEVSIDNADIGRLSYLTNAAVRGKLKTTKKDAGSGIFVWGENNTPLNGYPAFVTNNVPSNLTKSSGTDLSAIIFGNFEDCLIGMWGGIEVLPDPYTQATSGLLRLVINSFADVAIARAASFAAMVDAITN